MLRIAFSLLLLVAAFLPAAADCIPDWSLAAPIVYREKLATVEALSRMAAGRLSGSIVKTTLCHENGAYVYRLVLRDGQGRLTNHTLDARVPFDR
jgi:uncharacterized membrane protein YkoI